MRFLKLTSFLICFGFSQATFASQNFSVMQFTNSDFEKINIIDRSEIIELQENLLELENKLEQIKKSQKKDLEKSPNLEKTSPMYLSVRIDEFDEDLRKFSGEIENIQHSINELKTKLDNAIKDFELRLVDLESKTKQNSEISKINAKFVNDELQKRKDHLAKREKITKDLYEKALKDFKDNKLEQAKEKFISFVKKHPKNSLAGNSRFWLGEIFMKQKDFLKATRQYIVLQQKHPKNVKNEESLIKLAIALKELDQGEKACKSLDKLLKKQKASKLHDSAMKYFKKFKCKVAK